MKPITLNQQGDTLVNADPQIMEESTLPPCVGVHMPCGGVFNKWSVSAVHEVVRCSLCDYWFAIEFKKVRTFGDLRQDRQKAIS